VNYLSDAASADALVDDIIKNKGSALAIKADVSCSEDVEKLFAETARVLGVVDALVYCAAPPVPLKSFDSLSWADMQKQIDVQLKGAFYCAAKVLPGMAERKNGALVFIGSSVTEMAPPEKQADYITAKTAVNGLARALAAEYGKSGVRVNVVAPGMTVTERIANYPEKAKVLTKTQTPLRRLAIPEDVADMVVFLLGEKAKHITGQVFNISGGIVMK
jgi:3-oxoacyl-[acyl-carrier protein] reductase